MVLTLIASCVVAAGRLSSIEQLSILPSDTDSAIHQFDDAHLVFVDHAANPRNQLLVFLPGTGGKPGRTNDFCQTAADEGYQVVSLMYPDSIAAATLNRSGKRNDFLDFRLEIIEGRDLSKSIEVDRTNSIENRLIKLLRYLDKTRPTEHWGRFLTAKGDVNWPNTAWSGLSQGAGHAALIAVRHRVARAILFGGPKDFDQATHQPAAWYTPPATPPRYIFTFNHQQDRQGCNYQEQLKNCHALGLDKLGGVVNIDTAQTPYRHSHVLTTNYPGTPIASGRAHVSVVGDGATPRAGDGSLLFEPVWKYMLTAG